MKEKQDQNVLLWQSEILGIIENNLNQKKAVKIEVTSTTISWQYPVCHKQWDQNIIWFTINYQKEQIMLEFAVTISNQAVREVGTKKIIQTISIMNTDMQAAEYIICYQQNKNTILIKSALIFGSFISNERNHISEKIEKNMRNVEELFIKIFRQLNFKKYNKSQDKLSEATRQLQKYKTHICEEISKRNKSHSSAETYVLSHRGLFLNPTTKLLPEQLKQNYQSKPQKQGKFKDISQKSNKTSTGWNQSKRSNQDQEHFIVRPIQLCEIQESERINSDGNSNGDIWKIKACIKILYSMNFDKNFMEGQDIETELCTTELCKKKSKNLPGCQESHRSQIEILLYLRNFRSQKIASYYLLAVPEKNFDSIYCKWYNQSLSDVIRGQGKITFKLSSVKTLAQGIKFLRSKKILHRDLKPDNVMVEDNKKSKIIDFGSACPFHKAESNLGISNTLRSTRFYCYPYADTNQILQNQFTQRQFNQHENFDITGLGKIIQKVFEESNSRKELGQFFNKNISWLISKCILTNPQHRVNADQVTSYIKLLYKVWLLINSGTKRK